MCRTIPAARRALSALCAVCTLAACQSATSTSDFDFSYGEGLVAQCAASACTTLALDYAPLGDYRAVAGMGHVTSLMLGHTNFADLGDIAGMTQLQELHIAGTRVRDLSGIAALSNLRVLHMQDVLPESWAPLAGLGSLRELAVGHYDLNDLSFVAQMPRLERLYIGAVSTDLDLGSLGAHRGLRSIHFASDSVGDLTPLLRLPALREVSITAFDEGRHAVVIAQLRARGVRVTLEEPVIIVC